MKAGKAIYLAMLSGLLGLLLFEWPWVARFLGIELQIDRTGSIVTVEYLVGALPVILLGLLFYEHPVWCAFWFMMGPVLVTYPIRMLQMARVPNLWPMEVLMHLLLTIPYIALAFGASYIRRRLSSREATT